MNMENDNVIDYDQIEIDKSNELVNYNDKLHKYWIKDTKQNCISATTLIHRYTTFDEAFWSSYKALEAIMGVDNFKEVKKKLLASKVFNESYLTNANIDIELFNQKKAEVLKEWAVKRDESCVRGTIFHREKELGHLVGDTPEIKQLGLGGTFIPNTTNKIETGTQKVYPELLVSWVSKDGKLRLAGQIDLAVIDGNDLYILDYKSSKTIDKKSYFDSRTKKSQMMKYPLNNLQDSNFWHYSLQLSIYAWMIKKSHPEVEIKRLIIIHYDHDCNYTLYECDYLKDDVERMLMFYKKELEYEEFKKSREKIVF